MASNQKDDRMGFGLTLIFVGIIWLLFKFNILTFSVFGAISDLWPLLLVVAGINMIFYNKRVISLVTWILFIAVLIWYGQFGSGQAGSLVTRISGEEAVSRDASWKAYEASTGKIDMEDGVSQGNLKLDLGFGGVYIDSTISDDVEYSIPEEITTVYSRMTGKSASLEFEQDEKLFFNWGDGDPMDYDIKLPEEVEWDIDINTGAIDALVDLSDLNVRNLDIDCGAGDIEITYGDTSPLVYTEIDCGATEVTLNVPEGAGIEINIDGLVSENNFARHGLRKVTDSIYRSDDFEKEDIKIFVEIDTGIGDVTLNMY